ncbi:MAG: hypothetical protein QM734_09025 [Cyclobacteriaceae bacterium]
MTRTISIFIISLLFALGACHSSSQTENKDSLIIDTTKAIRIGNYWALPKEKFDFTSITTSHDTLTFLMCGDYPYFPFGPLTDKSQIQNSLLKNFTITARVDTIQDGPFEFQILRHKTSRLILFINDDPYGEKSSYIMKGDINDNDVTFENAIRIEMSKANFIGTFFDTFPDELISKYNIIAFETCLEDLRHTYIFNDGKLKSVNFKSHSYWKVNY